MVEVDLPHVHRGLLVRTVYILVWLGHTTRNHKSGDGKYGFFYNLVASSPGHSQILSRSCGEKSGEGLGAKLRHGPEMVDSVSTNRVHVTY